MQVTVSNLNDGDKVKVVTIAGAQYCCLIPKREDNGRMDYSYLRNKRQKKEVYIPTDKRIV